MITDKYIDYRAEAKQFSFSNYCVNTEDFFTLLGSIERKLKGWTWRNIERCNNQTSNGMMPIDKLDPDIQKTSMPSPEPCKY